MSEVDIYAVGLFRDVRTLRSYLRRGEYQLLRCHLKRLPRSFRRRSYWNGYLAEHATHGTRCGHGWTRGRAYRDLMHHLATGA